MHERDTLLLRKGVNPCVCERGKRERERVHEVGSDNPDNVALFLSLSLALCSVLRLFRRDSSYDRHSGSNVQRVKTLILIEKDTINVEFRIKCFKRF